MIQADKQKNTLVLHVKESRVDMVVARKFRESLTAQIKERPLKIVLDLQETEYFDSSALGALVAFMKDVKAYGGQLVLCNLSRSLHTLLKLSKLDQLFIISESLEDAVT
jgi:anti-sigma B factor antagonist